MSEKIALDGETGCLEWLASKNVFGYGIIWKGPGRGQMYLAHRVAYELTVGPIPEGKELDHLCRNRGCVEVTHLEPVSHRVNMLRAPDSIITRSRDKTHCPQGHAYDEGNTVRSQGRRQCRICLRAAAERWRQLNKPRIAAYARMRRARQKV
jgi:hypothetical protein